MRNALNNLQATHSGFGHVDQASVFKVIFIFFHDPVVDPILFYSILLCSVIFSCDLFILLSHDVNYCVLLSYDATPCVLL